MRYFTPKLWTCRRQRDLPEILLCSSWLWRTSSTNLYFLYCVCVLYSGVRFSLLGLENQNIGDQQWFILVVQYVCTIFKKGFAHSSKKLINYDLNKKKIPYKHLHFFHTYTDLSFWEYIKFWMYILYKIINSCWTSKHLKSWIKFQAGRI